MFFGADELDKKINEELKKDLDVAKLFVSEDLIQRTMAAVKESNCATPESIEIDENPIQNDSPARENHDFTNVTKEEMEILFHKEPKRNKNKSKNIWIKNVGKIAAVFALLLLCVKVITVLPSGSIKKSTNSSEQAELKMETTSEELSLDSVEDTEKQSSSTDGAEETLQATAKAFSDATTENSNATSSDATTENSNVTSSDATTESGNATSSDATTENGDTTSSADASNTGTKGNQSAAGIVEENQITFGVMAENKSKEFTQYSYENVEEIEIINRINDLFNNATKASAEYTEDITFDEGLDLQVDTSKRVIYYISENGNLSILEYNDNTLVSENDYQINDAADFYEKLKQIIK